MSAQDWRQFIREYANTRFIDLVQQPAEELLRDIEIRIRALKHKKDVDNDYVIYLIKELLDLLS